MSLYYRILNMLVCTYVFLSIVLPSTSKYKFIPINGDMILLYIMIFYLMGIILIRQVRISFINSLIRFFKNKFNIILILFIIIMIFSITYSADKNVAIRECIRYLSYMFIYFLISEESNNEEHLTNIIKSFIIIIITVSIVTIIDMIKGVGVEQSIETANRVRIESLLENSNNLGAFFILFIFPFIILAIYEREKAKKGLYIIISFLCLMNIIVSYSRNAWLAFGIGCLLIVVLYNRKFIVPFLGIGLLALFIPKISQRLLEFNDFSQNVTRIKLWKTTLLMIKDHLLFGVGIDNFTYQYDIYIKKYKELAYASYKLFHPHNTFLKVQVELGILGSIVFICLIAYIILKLKKYINNSSNNFYKNFYKGFFISFIVFMFIMNMVDNFFSAPKVTMMFVIIISVLIKLKNLEFS